LVLQTHDVPKKNLIRVTALHLKYTSKKKKIHLKSKQQSNNKGEQQVIEANHGIKKNIGHD